MADRKVYLDLKLRVVVRVDADTDIQTVIDELDYALTDTTGKATVEDATLEDFEVIDAK